MREFIGRMELAFFATADAHGECDSEFLRAGPPGFVQVLDDRTVAWPEYRGNGVMASAGNMVHNPHVVTCSSTSCGTSSACTSTDRRS